MKFAAMRKMENHARQVVRNVAICFAVMMGLVALYYCLLPALAETAGESNVYVFFDNGLSQYEGKNDTVVTYTVYDMNGSVTTENAAMLRLSDVISGNQGLWNQIKDQLSSQGVSFDSATGYPVNVNPKNVFVTPDKVSTANTVSFRGWDSGTVYDTVTNYRVNAASREWGYDYVDFQWISDPTRFDVNNTCYYAPPQMMVNRYAAVAATESGGPRTLVQMIYAHGDQKDDASSKPEVDGAWVDPQNAQGRTFYDAEIVMEGKFGKLNDINDLSKNSQSADSTLEGSVALGGNGDNGLGYGTNGSGTGANQIYHATATFFDYFSDWELAGNPLEDHRLFYTYDNETATDRLLFSAEGNKTGNTLSFNTQIEEIPAGTYTETVGPLTFPEGDVQGFTNVGSGTFATSTHNSIPSHTADGSQSVLCYSGAIGSYSIPANSTGTATIYVHTRWSATDAYAHLYYVLDGVEHFEQLGTVSVVDADGQAVSGWHELSVSFAVPAGATNAALRYSANDKKNIHFDDFSMTVDVTTEGTTNYTETTGTTNFANDYHGFVDQDNAAVSVDPAYSHIADGTASLGVDHDKHIRYSINGAADGKTLYTASIWSFSRDSSASRQMNITLHYQLNGQAVSETLDDRFYTSTTWTETAVTFVIPNGATDVYLDYAPRHARFQFDEFTLTSTLFNGDRNNVKGSNTNYFTFDVSGWAAAAPVFTVEVAGAEKTSDSYSNKELYFAKMDVLTLKDANVVFKAEHYDENGNLVSTVHLDPITVPGGHWKTIQSPTFELPLRAVKTKLTLYAEGDPSAKIYADRFWFYRAFMDSVTNEVFSTGFETADPYDFSVYLDGGGGNRVYREYNPDVARNGEYALHVQIANDTQTAVVVLPFDREKKYNLTMAVRPIGTDSSVDIAAKFLDANGNPIGGKQTIRFGQTVAAGTWYYYDIRNLAFEAPEGATQVRIYPAVHGTAEGFYIDDFSLTQIDLNDSGSYSDGTNRIAYAYQGYLLNKAISDYYLNANAPLDTVPLYFGSNSWMTGNMRYYLADRNKQALFTEEEVSKALEYLGVESTLTRDDYINTQYGDKPIYADGKVGQAAYANVGAYIIPLSREYWRNLFGFLNDKSTYFNDNFKEDNVPHGDSNSRGVEGLVTYDPSMDILMLDGTTLEAPYFSIDFLNGKNDANAQYGQVYEGVDFPFAYNEDSGYYEFDSTRSYYAVRLTQNGTTGEYYMDYYNYDKLVQHKDTAVSAGENVVTILGDANLDYKGVKKADVDYGDVNGSSQTIYQFYPFNSPETNDRFATENLMFGMKLDIPFNMTTNEDQMNESMFKFSGDDDVWVYVDGQQVLDIGGTHTAVGGFIDLKHGYGVVGSTYADYTGVWKNYQDLSQGMTKTTEQAIQTLEKAAFAALAALDEINIDPNLVASLGKTSEQTIAIAYELNGVTYYAYMDEHDPAATTYVRDYRTSAFVIPEGAVNPRLTVTGNVANMPIYIDNFGLYGSSGNEVAFTDFTTAPDYFVATPTSYHNTAVVPEWATTGGYQTVTVLLDEIPGFERGKEFYFDFDVAINALNPENITETDWAYSNLTDVDFFDDRYTFSSTSYSYTYRYRIRRDAASGELVIDVEIPNKITYYDSSNTAKTGDRGTVTFDLTQFTMQQDYSDNAISNHELSIYYLERGLNSSNFKLAFNFIPSANREVEKEWSNGDEAHKEDGVLVELYSAQPDELGGTFNLKDTGYSLVRVIGHQARETMASDLLSSGFIGEHENVSVQFQLADENINSAATLVLNGIPLTEEAYKQLYEKMGMRIYIDGSEVRLNNGDGVVDEYEFFNPQYVANGNYTADGFQIAYSTNDTGFGGRYTADDGGDAYGLVTEAQKRSAIKTAGSATEGGSVIKIEFAQTEAVAGDCDRDLDLNTWGIVNTDAYLIEAYGWDVANNTAVPVRTRKINNSTQATAYLTDRESGKSRTVKAEDMQFVITHILRERPQYYMDADGNYTDAAGNIVEETQKVKTGKGAIKTNVMTTAAVPGDDLVLRNANSGKKPYRLWRGTWSTPFVDVAYTADSIYNLETDQQMPNLDAHIATTGGSRAVILRAAAKSSMASELSISEFTYRNSYSETGYSNPEPYGDGTYDYNGDGTPDPGVYLLEDANDWTQMWANLMAEKISDNVKYEYRYFIRELAVLKKDANGNYQQITDTDYKTTYYADSVGEGHEIDPVYFTVNGENIALYSLDTERGKIVVLNDEVTDAEITKDWLLESGDESLKSEVTVDIFAEDPALPGVVTLYDTVTLNEDNGWKLTLKDLPIYNNNQLKPGKMIYYAAENNTGQFKATYNSTEHTKLLGSVYGSEIKVYLLNTEADGTLSLEVTNQAGGFVLEVDKYAPDGETPLEGAEFILYEWIGSGDPPENPTIQDIMNDPDNWQLVTDPSVTTTKSNIKKVAGLKAATISDTKTYNFSADASDNSFSGDSFFTIEPAEGKTLGRAQYGDNNTYPYVSDIVFDGKTFASKAYGLKMNSGPIVTFTTATACTVDLVIRYRTATYNSGECAVSIATNNGAATSYVIDDAVHNNNSVLTVELPAGTHVLKRSAGETLLFYIKVTPTGTVTPPSFDTSAYDTIAKSGEEIMKLMEGGFDYTSEEAAYLAEKILGYQITPSGYAWGLRVSKDYSYGGWQKDPGKYDTSSMWYYATIDNENTTAQLRYLARMYKATGVEKYRTACEYGIQCLINNQYKDSGGWPQIFAGALEDSTYENDYHLQITYNDNAQVNLLRLLSEVRDQNGDFIGIGNSYTATAASAIEKGIQCMLDTQIIVNGRYTAWCQQHDEDTLAPAWGRAFEPPAICTGESVNIVKYLMEVIAYKDARGENTTTLKRRVNAALTWLQDPALVLDVIMVEHPVSDGGCKYYSGGTCNCTRTNCRWAIPNTDKVNNPRWARFYSLADGVTPVWCDRDSDSDKDFLDNFEASYNNMSCERRSGYNYISNFCNSILKTPLYRLGGSVITDLHVNVHETGASASIPLGEWSNPITANSAVNYTMFYKGDMGDNWLMGANLGVGSMIYGNSSVTYASLPAEVLGGEFIRTASAFKGIDGTATFVMGAAKDVYIALESSAAVPSWMSGWTDSGLTATASNGTGYKLYKKAFASGETVTLGVNTGTVGYTVMVADAVSEDITVNDIGDGIITNAITPPANAMIYTTDANGTVSIGGLRGDKIYALIEVNAPVGYVPMGTPTMFEISKVTVGANVGAINTNKLTYWTDTEYVEMQWTDKINATLTASVKNATQPVTLPNTGASPISILLRGIAALLPVLAGLHFIWKRMVCPVE